MTYSPSFQSSISLDLDSVVKGQKLALRVDFPDSANYKTINIEIYEAGTRNQSFSLGVGENNFLDPSGAASINHVDTSSLNAGFYDVGIIKYLDRKDSNGPKERVLVSGKDFDRKVFQVILASQNPLPSSMIIGEVQRQQACIEKKFLEPVHVGVKSEGAREYAAFVFIKDLLIGTRMRFENSELIPTNSGLDTKDQLNFINNFFEKFTSLKVKFKYDEHLSKESQGNSPVCTVYFPSLIALNDSEANKYSVINVNLLLAVLALLRDGSGNIFSTIILDKKTNLAKRYSYDRSYQGNLLTGVLASESINAVEACIKGISRSNVSQFLVDLFKQALNETHRGFKYVRFWQILEIIAEGKNYDSTQKLLDFDGNDMIDGESFRKIQGSIHIVFNLLKEIGIGDSINTWRNVNVWFAFRCAVAHHGSINKISNLSRKNVRIWGERGLQQITSDGFDVFIESLKDTVKFILRRQLIAASVNNSN